MSPESPQVGGLRADGRRTWDVIFLSFRILYFRLALWIRLNLWTVLLSLPIITAPAAAAALTATTRAALLDEHENSLVPRAEFRAAFFRYLGISIALVVSDLAAFVLCAGAFVFWMGLELWYQKLPGIVAGFFLALWWLVQPLLFPALIELSEGDERRDQPPVSILQLVRVCGQLALAHPLQTGYVTLINTLLVVIGVVLMGPMLLVFPALLAVISVQTAWLVLGQPIPAWDTPPPQEE